MLLLLIMGLLVELGGSRGRPEAGAACGRRGRRGRRGRGPLVNVGAVGAAILEELRLAQARGAPGPEGHLLLLRLLLLLLLLLLRLLLLLVPVGEAAGLHLELPEPGAQRELLVVVLEHGKRPLLLRRGGGG